jgi:hypothetical protein
LIADRAESWSPAPAQYRALLNRRLFERRTVRTLRPDSSPLYCITTREIVGFSWRLLFGFFDHVANTKGLRALVHRELHYRFQ